MNKKLQQKIKKLNILKDKMRDLKNEIDNLSQEIQSEKDKEFNLLSKAFFVENDIDKKSEIEQKIKSLIQE